MGEIIITESNEESSEHHIPGMNRLQVLSSGEAEADVRLSDDAMEAVDEAAEDALPVLVELFQEDADRER